MGYTHYQTHKGTFTKAEWKVIQADVRAILETATADGLTIGDAWGEKKITPAQAVTAQEIRFNGLDGDSHETFSVERLTEPWAFCKTARKPYDVAVTAILAYLEGAHPDKFSVGSDGGPDDWKDGIALLKKALGTRAEFAQPPAEVLQEYAES